MIYQTDRIVHDVRVCMDENAESGSLLETGDTESLSLDETIRSKVPEAIERVHTAAPYHLLECGHNFGDAVYWGELESGWVLLPEDFMRLVVFEMDDWERAVYRAVSAGEAEYARQRSRIKALRGTPQRPVCAVGVRPEGRVLEFYSCRSTDAQVSRAVYIPYPKTDADGGVDVSERCYTAVVYTAAGLSLTACGEAEKGNVLSGLAQTYLKQ